MLAENKKNEVHDWIASRMEYQEVFRLHAARRKESERGTRCSEDLATERARGRSRDDRRNRTGANDISTAIRRLTTGIRSE